MSDKRELKKVMVAYRKEFQGKLDVQAIMSLGRDDYDKHPILKEKGFDFVEVQRLGSGKLQVLFV